ncbi:hypothetical protein B0A55_07360 [Friedmanniomyces simplex]|uniref:Uncharacterized protein n=1 Tax=Friedmanniomyces simplex TaxID=329884 RepID=A0A4U0X4F1_9PEZI|nr:hypothetical protein B0A55_07360 [Friedmanniomyces simplex]
MARHSHPTPRLLLFNAITKQSLQDPETSAWSTLSLFDPPFKPAYLANGWTRKSLAPYTNRKFQVLFLDFPVEISNQVYGHLFNFSFIELAPLHTTGESNGLIRIHHMKHYKYTIVPHLCLLRTNKQIHSEATPVFYGQNEFRFTNVSGFDTLAYFCRTIGRTNTAFLRKITECCPKPPSRADIRSDGTTQRSITGWGNFEHLMTCKMGMRKGDHRFRKFTVARTADVTSVDSGLQQYKCFIADEHDLDDGFDTKQAGGLLGRMSMRPDPGRAGVLGQIIEHVESNGFEVVRATYDALGRSEVPEKRDGDENDGGDDVGSDDQA